MNSRRSLHAFALLSLLVPLILGGASVAQAQNPSIATYRGSVQSGGTYLPIVTTLYKDSRGQIVGEYVIHEDRSKTYGSLSQFTPIGEDTAKFTWTDKYGSGKLRILFSSNLEEFTGFWGQDERTNYRWTGIREVHTPVAERRSPTSRSVRTSHSSSQDIKRAIVKISGAGIADAFARDQKQNDGLIAALFSVGARAGRDKLIESAIKDVFPEMDDIEIRGIRRVACLYLDGKLSLANLGKDTAKEEIIEALKEENPTLATSAQIVDFLYELHLARTAAR